MNIRIHALETEAADATIAPSPWGMFAESIGIGICDVHFTPGKFAQQLALVCRKDFFHHREEVAGQLPRMMLCSKDALSEKSGMSKAVAKMARIGNLELTLDLLEKAAEFNRFGDLPPAVAPDEGLLAQALTRLRQQEVQPSHLASPEQMARLLVSNHMNPHHVS